MTRIRLWAGLLALAACAPPGPGLTVQPVDGYYWPAPVAQGVEAFPLVDALLVGRRDGVPLAEGDADTARMAAEAHCRARGRTLPGPAQRLDAGHWAFLGCG